MKVIVQKSMFLLGAWREAGDEVPAEGFRGNSLRALENSGRVKLVEGEAKASPPPAVDDAAETTTGGKPVVADEEPSGHTKESLMKMKKADLVDMAAEAGLDTTGTKADIVDRLL